MRCSARALSLARLSPEESTLTFESSLRQLKSRVFISHGRRPYARGYISYRQTELPQYIHREFPEGVLPDRWGMWLDERVIEYPWFLSRLPDTSGRLLDAGSALNHDCVLSHERLRNKTLSIYTLAPESESYCHRGISYLYGDLRDCCFRDEYFDWIVSISTLEHVGLDNTRHYTKDRSKNECCPESHLQALRELRRVLKSSGILYITLPYGRAGDHGWLQIFDAEKVQKLVDVFRPGSMRESYYRYTSSGWQLSSPEASRDAGYFDISQPPSNTPKFAAAESVVCLELVK